MSSLNNIIHLFFTNNDDFLKAVNIFFCGKKYFEYPGRFSNLHFIESTFDSNSEFQKNQKSWICVQIVNSFSKTFEVVTDVYVSPNLDHSKSFPTLTICLNSMHSDSKVKEFHNQDQQTVWQLHIVKIKSFTIKCSSIWFLV